MKITALIFLAGTVALLTASETPNWSSRIVCKTERPLAGLLNPHVEDLHILTVDGKRFEHVRGIGTFYLDVPETNAILFVVEEKGHGITYHFYNMDTREDIAVRSLGSVFGHTIGSPPVRDTVTIDPTNRDKLILCSATVFKTNMIVPPDYIATVKGFYGLDLKKHEIVSDKTVFYNKNGLVVKEHNQGPPF